MIAFSRKAYPTLFILLLLLGLTAQAQSSVTLTGQVVDGPTDTSLPYVNIGIYQLPGEALLTGAITDDNGRFQISDIPLGNYLVRITYLGYTEVSREVVAGGLNPVFDLGRILMEPSATALEGVEVTGREATTSAALDKKTFSLEEATAQLGGSVMDAMKTLPGVTFDQEGKVILRGSDKVMVLVDGKQSSLTGFGNQKGLASIPASNVEKIEIINNPSARYDATGFAGIVNIVFKKNTEDGFHGDVGLSAGVGALWKREPDVPTALGSYSVNPKVIPSLNLNYRKGPLQYNLQTEFILQEALPNNEFTTRYYTDGQSIASQVPENRRQFRSIASGGVDWALTERTTLRFSGLYDREIHIDTAQVAFVNLNTNARNRFYTWEEEEVTRYINAGAQLTHEYPQPGHTLQAGFQYTQGLEDETYSLNDSSAVRIGRDGTNIRAVEHTSSFTTDYTRPLPSGKFEVGGRLRIRRLPVTYTIDQGQNSIIYPDLGTYSKWGENLYAVYGNYVLEKKAFDVEAGLRTEYTEVFYDLDPVNAYYPQNDAYDYLELFPSLRFTLKWDDRNRLSLFFNRRIDRPGEPELRVFPKYDDPELLKVGNPYLRPQLTYSFEVAHKYLWGQGSLYSAVYHRSIEAPYLRIFEIDASNPDYNIVNRIYQNVGNATNSGIELLLSQKWDSRWEASASFNGYINSIDAFSGTLLFPEERPFSINASSDPAWDGKFTVAFTVPGKGTAQVTTVYQSARNIPQGEQLGRASVDVGLKKNLWEGRGEFFISASDLLNTFGIRQEITGDGFRAEYRNLYETQVIRTGLIYRF